MISFNCVSKHFGNRVAVDGISFEVTAGETFVLLGPSGCGKTTTLKMINRLVEPDSGEITLDGRLVTRQDANDLRKGIGYVMQHAGLFPHYTVRQNIAVVPTLLRWEPGAIKQKTALLVRKLKLPDFLLDLYPHQLSGGQQQRVGIARALIANSPVLLMDEPFAALDNITRTEIHEEFSSLEELRNKTIILVTHDVQEAFELGNRIGLMENGRIVQVGTPREMLYRPATHFVKQFFESNSLLLEHKIATLKDIQPFLQGAGLQDFNPKTTVWQLLEELSMSREASGLYEVTTNAFAQYRKTQFQ
ncbi:MAG: ATP-binding cassette domain-containing protein [Chitinophagaceae bacterium]|nr:MAG: ATP-binding cassette domain-containing protein [Chitinophagaceae bacterium]